MMKAAFIKRHNKVKIRYIPRPRPGKGEILIKINACALCSSDFIEAKLWAKNWKRFGHEIAGTIEETGKNVKNFSPGDQVAISLSTNCGTCQTCVSGNVRRCTNLITAEQGGFAEYLLIRDQRLLYKVSPELPPELLCLAEPITVVLDAFNTAGLRPGGNLLVIGGGFMGKLALLIAKASGINVAGLLNRKKNKQIQTCLEAAKGEHFIWHTMLGKTKKAPFDLYQKLIPLTGKVIVLHTAPACYIPKYVDFLPFDSVIVNIGLSAVKSKNKIAINASKLVFNRIQLMSGFPVPCLNLPKAIELLQKNRKLFSLLPVKMIKLEELPKIISSKKPSDAKILIKL